MNKATRKRITNIGEQQMEIIIAEMEEIRDEEQEKFDNLPEGIQESEKGEKFEESNDALDELIQELETAFESMQRFTEEH